MFQLDDHMYQYPADKDIILREIQYSKSYYAKRDKNIGNIYYKSAVASLDLETTSAYYNGDKVAIMYIWMFSVNGKVISGRTWEDFEYLMTEIEQYTAANRRLLVFVHNLGFDFTFFCKHLHWSHVFGVKPKTPIYAITTSGIEFRDSYILTGKSLDSSAKDLVHYKVNKQVGTLNYDLIRGSTTPLTDKELQYCVYDCLTLDAIIKEKQLQEGFIHKIPLTNTGYVRRFLRWGCLGRSKNKSNQNKQYSRLMQLLTIKPKEYAMLKRAFMGGFTHANALYVGQTIKLPVDSFDFTSSYPAVILSELFPMSSGTLYKSLTQSAFSAILKDKLSIFDVQFNNIRPMDNVFENYLSESKCKIEGKSVINNGRVVKADKLFTTVTNIDFQIIKNFYKWDSIQIGEVLAYDKGPLPKEILEGVITLYEKKTELKGVEGAEVDYMLYKGMLNACYGCMVTDIVKPTYSYNETVGWSVDVKSEADQLSKYNNSRTRFLYYPWGVFVTAYARRNLLMGIQEFGQDYIYSDTDSIKCINASDHMGFINWYNKFITDKVRTNLSAAGIDPDRSAPKNKKGSVKPIGIWDHETKYDPYVRFKTLGAKRYMSENKGKPVIRFNRSDHNFKIRKGDRFYRFNNQSDVKYERSGSVHITIAGLPKKSGAKWLESVYKVEGIDPFDNFNDYMSVPAESTGKLLHSYIDCEKSGTLTDYLGNEFTFDELDGVHLEPTDFTLKLTDQFQKYVKGYRENNIYE